MRAPVRGARATVTLLAAVLTLAGCTEDESAPQGGGTASPPASSSSPPSPAGSTSKSPSTTAAVADLPEPPPDGACYRLDFRAATEPTNDSAPVPCGRRHTAQTYHVGRLDTVVDGHLLAVDSRLAQRQVAKACPRMLGRHLGGSSQTRALSRFEAVWFSPTIDESDQGASWFRCDVVAVAGTGRLAPLPPPRQVRGMLDDPAALDRVGLCGTAAPGAAGFKRVICSDAHSWRAKHHPHRRRRSLPGCGGGTQGRGERVPRPRAGGQRLARAIHLRLGVADPGPVAGGPALRVLLGPGLRPAFRNRVGAAAWGRAASPWRS